MAYFGGTVSQRPWSRFDMKFIILLVLSVGGLVAAVWMVRESIVEQLAANRQTDSTTVAPPLMADMKVSEPVAEAAPAAPARSYEVLVAVEQINAGTRLRPAMFRLETKTDDSNLAERALLNLNEIEGAYSRVSMAPGSPLLRESVAAMTTNADITERIPPGYRAVAIPVNLVSGVEGWVQPGARVDVVWTTEARGKMITTTLVENAQVLSAERRLEGQSDDSDQLGPVPSHVTLLVTTKDSQRLQLAKNSGSLSLSLRGDKDVDPGNAATLSTDSIIKNRGQHAAPEHQGKVTIGGQNYILAESGLVPENQYQAQMRAKMKENPDF